MSEQTPWVTYLLLALNVIMFIVSVAISGGEAFSTRMLYDLGAVTNDTLVRHEYWRLLAAAFLHGGFLHIFMNMVCLVQWGPPVEARMGPLIYLVIYLISAVGGTVTSILLHSELFISVGASGALSGLVGALLALSLMGQIGISAQFFVSIIVLNGVIMATNPHIDWMSHLGGFLAGLIATALLGLVVRRSEV